MTDKQKKAQQTFKDEHGSQALELAIGIHSMYGDDVDGIWIALADSGIDTDLELLEAMFE